MPTVHEVLTAAQAHLAAGRNEAAAAIARRVIGVFADQPDAWHILGLAGGDRRALRRAAALAPGNAGFQVNLAKAGWRERGFRLALALAPGDAGVVATAGLHWLRAGAYDRSVRSFTLAFRLRPRADVVGGLMGAVLLKGKAGRTAAGYGLLAALEPASLQAYFGLGHAWQDLGFYDRARQALAAHLRRMPTHEDSWRHLAEMIYDSGRAALARRVLSRVVALNPQDSSAAFLYIQFRNVMDGLTAAGHAAERRVWAGRFADMLSRTALPHANPRDRERVLTIGWIAGGTLRASTHLYIVYPIVAAIDRARHRHIFYSDLGAAQEDRWTAAFAEIGTVVRSGRLDDIELAARIRADRVDVLIDLVGHLGGHRALTMARRPAPVQAILAHIGTSGQQAIDFAICDRVMLEGADPAQFVEAVPCVPVAYCFRPIPGLPDPAPPPSERLGVVTFGSLNALSKVTPRCVSLWSRVLKAVPGSRLVLKGKMFGNAFGREGMARRFAPHGIGAERLVLKPWSAGFLGHMHAYAEIDVALDTVPYVGVTTTLEALYMGVPVVTLRGARVAERYGAVLLRGMGRPEDVAEDEDGFVARAVALAGQDRGPLRRSLRGDLMASPVADGRLFARHLEAIMRQFWHRWCGA
ncbi:MAG: tetratricopeptide repeat protein [Thalassobaculales bacterium]